MENQDLVEKQCNLGQLRSYIKFSEAEILRALDIKDRNSFFKIIFSLFKKNNEIGFLEFNEIGKELDDLLSEMMDRNNFSDVLDAMQKDLEIQLKTEKLIENKLALVYMISRIKDKMASLGGRNVSNEDLLKENLEVGDILLLNKKLKKQDIGSKLLKVYDNKYLTDFTHCVIFIGFDNNFCIKIRHSTQKPASLKKQGVEDTLLNSYMYDKHRNNAFGYDVLVLRPSDDLKLDILNFSESNLGKGYDNRTALRQGLKMEKDYNDKYNCVEIVTQGLNPQNALLADLSKKTFPNDFLEYLDIFKPVYISTINKV